jgi:hypothetical protein
MSYLKHKPGSIEEIMANQNQKLNDNAYQDMFKKELEKAGRGIGAMSPKEKKDFFNKIDDKYKAKNEEVQVIDPKDIEEKKNYKNNTNFFVNDKTDTLKKMTGRRDYSKRDLLDYLAQKTNKKEDDVYFDDTELVYKNKTVLKNAETKTVAQMLQALKNEELHPRDVPHLKKMVKDGASDEDIKKMHPRITDYELEKLKESVIDPKGIKEEDAYENDRYIIKNGKATLDNSNTPDKKNHVYADGHKDAEKKAKAKGIKETHTFVTNKQNQKQKDVDGEKKVVDPKPKMSFKEAYKKVKENQSTVDDSTQDRANQGDSLDDNSKDPDIKKPKGKADTGSKPTPVDTSPEIEYKN